MYIDLISDTFCDNVIICNWDLEIRHHIFLSLCVEYTKIWILLRILRFIYSDIEGVQDSFFFNIKLWNGICMALQGLSTWTDKRTSWHICALIYLEPQSYDSCMYIYLCNQWLSPLNFVILIACCNMILDATLCGEQDKSPP